MWLDDDVSPLEGQLCRHVPDGSPYDPLDPRFAAAAADNRWNDRGEPTLYLGNSHEVLAVEWARHFPRDGPLAAGRRSRLRRIYDVAVALDAVLDLRTPRLSEALSLVNMPYCFAEKELCRITARRLRGETSAQALIVPSLGMLDRSEAWILVLFVDKLPSFPAPYLAPAIADGTFGLVE